MPFLRNHPRPAETEVVNGIFGIVDYLAQPIAMLIAAPLLIRHLGMSQYGVLMLAIATAGAGSVFGASFGDAAVKHVSACRGRKDLDAIRPAIRCILAVNICMGGALALLLFIFAPALARVMKVDAGLRLLAIRALQIGAVVVLLRSVESVLIGVLRGFEKYRVAAVVTSSMRIIAVVGSVFLAYYHYNAASIMAAILCAVAAGVALLAVSIQSNIGAVLSWPSWNAKAISNIMSFGVSAWLLGLSGMVFNQLDRLIVGLFLGPVELGYYSVCAQATQPIHGIIASGLHFLFPRLSMESTDAGPAASRRLVKQALSCNLVLAILLSAPLIWFSRRFLTLWMGPSFAAHAWLVLALLSIAAGLLALNVTGHYGLLALGYIRHAALLNLIAGASMLAFMALMIPRLGLIGAALGRIGYGPITWLMYPMLSRVLHSSHLSSQAVPSAIVAAEI